MKKRGQKGADSSKLSLRNISRSTTTRSRTMRTVTRGSVSNAKLPYRVAGIARFTCKMNLASGRKIPHPCGILRNSAELLWNSAEFRYREFREFRPCLVLPW